MNGTHSALVTLTLARIVHAMVTDDTVPVDLEDSRTISVPIGWYPRLGHGTPAERANFEISGAGYGIHWPDGGFAQVRVYGSIDGTDYDQRAQRLVVVGQK